MSPAGFGIAMDPMLPGEVTVPPGLAERPPYCPDCTIDVLLYPSAVSPVGDMLFSCLNDGYEAVFRVATSEWVPRPGREVSKWEPPSMVAPSQKPAPAPATPAGAPFSESPRPVPEPVPDDDDEPEPVEKKGDDAEDVIDTEPVPTPPVRPASTFDRELDEIEDEDDDEYERAND